MDYKIPIPEECYSFTQPSDAIIDDICCMSNLEETYYKECDKIFNKPDTFYYCVIKGGYCWNEENKRFRTNLDCRPYLTKK
ncbi:MAG: hypothetical protein ACP5KG_00390 [Myxococcota bacterium]